MRKFILDLIKTNHDRDAYLWNIAAGLINACEGVLLLMAVTRVTGIEDAGILTISMAVANILLTIGKFGMRNLQVTDREGTYSFSAYLASRGITCLLMALFAAVYAYGGMWLRGYPDKKAHVMMMVCLIYMLEALEDVYGGLYQRKGRLDVSAKIFSVRWIVTLAVYIGALACFKSLLRATLAALIAEGLMLAYLLRITYPVFRQNEDRVEWKKAGGLLWHALPFAMSGFFSFYVINAPKYAIDKYLPDEAQACYGFVSMPVFVINLLNNFIYQPTVARMALEWEGGGRRAFRGRIVRQLLYIAAITMTCIAGAQIAGIPVLSFLYHTDLTAYKAELMLILIGGGMLAVDGYLGVVITVMKRQKAMLAGYLSVAAAAAFLSGPAVARGGTAGAAVLYAALAGALAVVMGGIILIGLRNAAPDLPE